MKLVDKIKEFKPSSWAIDNKTSVYILTIIITIAGISAFNGLPKEQFPEVVFPQILVSTAYPGTSPKDMENLVSKQIEKQVKSIAGVKKITSSSIQDFSMVNVEFNTDVDVPVAKQNVKDAVDKAKKDLPNDLPSAPSVMDIDISQMPIMNVHLSGDFDLDKLKKFADDFKDRVEGMKEITRVDIVGALDREIKVDVDMYKMQATEVTFRDIETAIANENITISGGQLRVDGIKRSLSVAGQFIDVHKIGDIIVRSGSGATLYLKDIATISDGFKEQESFARLDGKNVITLNIIKRSGANLIDASDKIKVISEDMKNNVFPEGLNITITGDQSRKTRTTLHDLVNTIIIGFILVSVILMFFMGATNAIFVALSVPLSMCIAFMVMPGLDFTLNMIVLFSFLLALGIVVDDAIVVIENTHRIFDNGKMPIKQAAKTASGEVFMPVFSGTLTTLAPFIPLAFWKGIIGQFMIYLPITLIITLTASLAVAYIINPVFAVDFMKTKEEEDANRKNKKKFRITSIVFAVLAFLAYITLHWGIGNFIVFIYLLYLLNRFVLHNWISYWQDIFWPRVQTSYKKLVSSLLIGKKPIWVVLGVVGLFIFSIVFTMIRKPGVVFFTKSEPNYVYTYIRLPIGTDQTVTDSITKIVEKRIYSVVGDSNPIVESIIANVAIGAGEQRDFESAFSSQSHLGKVTVAFVEFGHRSGQSTEKYLDKIRAAVKGIPGAVIAVEQEQGGPPTGKPVNIEISGDDFDELAVVSQDVKRYLDSLAIPGVEELKSDLQTNKPELIVQIDRERANREGISTGQIGMELRTAIFGKEVSKFKDLNDEYPIHLRYAFDQRNNINTLMNLKISYRDMNMNGLFRSIPLSSLASIKYVNSYGGIKRKNQKRVVTIASNVLSGFTANEVVAKVEKAMTRYKLPDDVLINMTGEKEEQKETSKFLGNALLISLGLMFLILVTQFNSFSKPIIILLQIVLSIIGVLIGFSLFKMNVSIVMTGVGIFALVGIVVRNGILLVEFADRLHEEGMNYTEAIAEAGRIRMTPVILTALAAILGLIPLAVGLNIDFENLFTKLNPNIFFGGDSVAFWGPLSWTIIFGLIFSTFFTLILIPVLLSLSTNLKKQLGIKIKEA